MILKANELRVGNYIKFNNHIEKEKIIQINLRFFASWAGGRSAEDMRIDEEINDYYQPIPLTEQWLERFGFEKLWDLNKNQWSLYIDEGLIIEATKVDLLFYIRLCISQDNFDENIDTSCFVAYRDIGYISFHTLQNLYYSITGCELEEKK